MIRCSQTCPEKQKSVQFDPPSYHTKRNTLTCVKKKSSIQIQDTYYIDKNKKCQRYMMNKYIYDGGHIISKITSPDSCVVSYMVSRSRFLREKKSFSDRLFPPRRTENAFGRCHSTHTRALHTHIHTHVIFTGNEVM